MTKRARSSLEAELQKEGFVFEYEDTAKDNASLAYHNPKTGEWKFISKSSREGEDDDDGGSS